jgi:hypothetical protein
VQLGCACMQAIRLTRCTTKGAKMHASP